VLLVFPVALYFKPPSDGVQLRRPDCKILELDSWAEILGGLAGLSGPIPILWASVRGWDKNQRRGVFQTFNWTVLSAAFACRLAPDSSPGKSCG